MEKTSLESSYNTLTNTEPIPNQFYILQEDGTILATDKDIQYITQTADSNDAEQNAEEASECVDYDTTSQQYYVDVNSAPQLISINDQYVIPSVDNSVYTNSYLIQPEPATAPEQCDINKMEPMQLQSQLQLTSVELLDHSKQDNFTEITLSDEQYQLLQQKGWILLDCNSKVFVLNSLGLHDITDNHKLIQKLKSELQEHYVEVVRKTSLESTDNEPPIDSEHPLKQESDSELVIADEQTDNCTNEYVDVEMEEQSSDSIETEIDDKLNSVLDNNGAKSPLHVTADENVTLNCDAIKIKTKYIFKDIPNKILLGRTVNGKNLYAKVTKVIKDKVQKSIIKNNTANRKNPLSLQIEMKSQGNSGLDSDKFISLVRESFRLNSVPSEAAVAEVVSYVAQLLTVTGVRDTLVGANVVVTKLVISSTEEGEVVSQPVLVTGTVKTINDVHSFTHDPHLLRTILEHTDGDSSSGSKVAVQLFHIHVTEHEDTQRIHLQYTTRKLPLEVLRDGKKLHFAPQYACAACGHVFNTTEHYERHQEHCGDSEPPLHIASDDVTGYSCTTQPDGAHAYTCLTCRATFSREFNCVKHQRVHGSAAPLRCRMCAAAYRHAATLTKHIRKAHLNIQQ